VGSAEEQECKEAFLAYYFLATAGAPMTQSVLEQQVEAWLKDALRADVDFEVTEALAKLECLALLRRDGEMLAVLPLDEALAALDRRWAGFFPVAT
jgi:hypothetical protein